MAAPNRLVNINNIGKKMKGFACTTCDHVWFEPDNNKKRPGWGCPNGCMTGSREVNKDIPIFILDAFDSLLKKADKEPDKAKIRYHLNLLRKNEKYPFE